MFKKVFISIKKYGVRIKENLNNWVEKIKNTKKIKISEKRQLKGWEIFLIATIMFGPFILSSTQMFFEQSTNSISLEKSVDFPQSGILKSIMVDILILSIVFLFLKWRKFDFNLIPIKINKKGTLFGVFLFIIVAFASDLFFLMVSSEFRKNIFLGDFNLQYLSSSIQNIVSLEALHAIFNGFYEEIFFVGICLAVSKKYWHHAFIFSLIIRFAFHTYQGLINALGITIILGPIYYYIIRKNRLNLYPIILSHILADIFGLTVLSFFIS
ncbi:CPBP family intramembrane glutamic endopeptidase [Staphylococcus chromogenes]|uniref:CPBP family intramembrane glutamic endopeptidase n=1 Tax=Staphylococcus chromogenes TaxID=46126 RepID=UPI003EBC2745